MAYQWLSQELIHWDWELNPNDKHDDHIRALAKHMNENGYDPKFPVIVYPFETGEGYRAATGHHRLEASLLEDEEFPNLPLSEVYVEIVEGDYKQYIRRMLVDNHQHVPGFNKYIGRTPTRTELRASRYRLMFFPDVFGKSNRLLAKEWGCDHKTVAEIRNCFEDKFSRGDFSPPAHVDEVDIEKIKKIIKDNLYIGLDGKKYPRTTQAKQQVVEKPQPKEAPDEHTERLAALPGIIKELIPQWQTDNAIEGAVNLKLLLNARWHVKYGRQRGTDPFFREEMEDLLTQMQSNDATLIEKVQALLPTKTPPVDDKPTAITEAVKQAIRKTLNDARAKSDNGNGGGVNGVSFAPIAKKHSVPVELVAEIARGEVVSCQSSAVSEEVKKQPAPPVESEVTPEEAKEAEKAYGDIADEMRSPDLPEPTKAAPTETEASIQFEIAELDICFTRFDGGKKETDYIFINDDAKHWSISDLPDTLVVELTNFLQHYMKGGEKFQ